VLSIVNSDSDVNSDSSHRGRRRESDHDQIDRYQREARLLCNMKPSPRLEYWCEQALLLERICCPSLLSDMHRAEQTRSLCSLSWSCFDLRHGFQRQLCTNYPQVVISWVEDASQRR